MGNLCEISMNRLDIARARLQNQHISLPGLKKPADVVQWLGAVQSQDYYGAKWALGLRLRDASDEAIERAFAAGEILRTHVMRPTWHFVAPADIRWLLKLTAPRVNAKNAYYYRKLELDDQVFKRSNKALANALSGGRQLTREQLRTAIRRASLVVDDLLRFNYILIRAELDGLICSGARRGNQFTYALLDERVPTTGKPARDEALAELARRYFTSHGPATLADFVWWSGLTAKDARSSVEMVQGHLVKEVIDGKSYWLSSSGMTVRRASRLAYLLPAFDEYLVSYKDRGAAVEGSNSKQAIRSNVLLGPVIVIGGRVVGTWKRTLEKKAAIITLNTFAPLSKADKQAVAEAADLYGAFLGMTVVLA
jgi:hypothetical protein